MDRIKEKLRLLTTSPGCYLMKNVDGKIIYVGKAKNLKRRVSSYFNREHTGKTKALVENIVDFEYIVTQTEVESLLLEINLIKKYSPKYNIMLKDNKSYPYIEITSEKHPRLIISRPRNIKGHKGKLFGPYPNSNAARKTVELLNRIYPFRKCHNMPDKVCLYYHIGQCLGYCANDIDSSKEKEMIDEVTSFLKGNYDDVIKKVKYKMEEASNHLNFEKAMEYIGGIVENPDMYGYMSAVDNLKLFAKIRNINYSEVYKVLELVGLKKSMNQKVSKYSLGMKQRAGLALSLLHSPKVLILDEPTNGLDPVGIKELRDILKKLISELELTNEEIGEYIKIVTEYIA